MMANGLNAFDVKRPAAALAPVYQFMVDYFLPGVDRDDGLLRLLVLVPAGSLVIAGLLVIALSRLVGTPALAPSQSSSGADAEFQMDVPLVTEIEVRLISSSASTASRPHRTLLASA